MLVILLAILYATYRIIEIEPNHKIEPKVEFCDNWEHVEKKITNLLKETEECLYYYGAAGFTGDYQPWKKELEDKLKSEEIKFGSCL